ncbi:MAG: hypothetical protein LGR52_02025 [Candidatus Thiosymbion ectosymbiont of Robbea hypermnestra]|nr:hypothetical protein [Candidatus Thiosymbion ectosymbiont of Robbea hypermnestra]
MFAPRIIQPPSGTSRTVFVLSILAAFAAAIVGAFSVGTQVGIETSRPLDKHMRMTASKCNALSEQVSNLEHQSTVLKRSQQIDQEIDRNLSKQLKKAQDERLALEKEVSFLRRLIRKGGSGILQPKDFKVEKTGEPGMFRYNFTIRQLVQDFGRSTGKVEIRVIGKRNGRKATLPLDKLAGSEPPKHKMGFKYFQVFRGLIKIPDNFEPEKLVVEVRPKTSKLIPVSETFPWPH